MWRGGGGWEFAESLRVGSRSGFSFGLGVLDTGDTRDTRFIAWHRMK